MRINSTAMLFKYMQKGVAFDDRKGALQIQRYESILREEMEMARNLMLNFKPTYSSENNIYDDGSSAVPASAYLSPLLVLIDESKNLRDAGILGLSPSKVK